MEEIDPLHRPGPTVRRSARLARAAAALLLASVLLLLVVGGVSLAATRGLPDSVTYDGTIADVIAHVTTPTLIYELSGLTGERPITIAGGLHTLTTRHTFQTQAISLATRYAYEQLAQSGLSVTFHTYTYSNRLLRNVVAERPGMVDPDEIYLLTAHLDSTSNEPSNDPAPGADDNGSGSVAVLMAARFLAPYCFSNTLRFALFTGEEQGLRGSGAYAASSAALGEGIAGVVNLDMIGYSTGAPVFDAYARSGPDTGSPESRQLADVYSDVVGIYDLDLVPYRINMNGYPLIGGSDQSSFLIRGYPAMLVIEDYDGFDSTPYYHKATDRVPTLNPGYFQELTRASVAMLAHLGGLIAGEGTLSGKVTAQDGGGPLRATVAAYSLGNSVPFTTRARANGVYSLTLPAGWYTLTVSFEPRYFPATLSEVAAFCATTVAQNMTLVPEQRSFLPLVGYVP